MTLFDKILGIICIISGLVFLFLGIAPFLKTILFILLGLFLINYGLRLCAMPTATQFARIWWFQSRRFR